MNGLVHLLYVIAEGLVTLGISWLIRATRDRKAHAQAAANHNHTHRETP